jgi:hypothetical protein
MRVFTCLAAAALVAACSEQPAEEAAANQAAVPAPAKTPHCFFKDSETKDWAARVQGDTVVVSGRAFRSDARYKADLLEPEVDGAVAVVRPTIVTNDTGFASEGNWWDVSAEIPAEGLQSVEVRCGKKVVASLALAAKAG